MHFFSLPSVLALLAFTSALPSSKPPPKPLPLIIWHGLGDRHDADGLHSTGDLALKVHPGTYVYYIRTDEDGGNDRTNTFFGNLTTQIEEVCETLHNNTELRAPNGGGLRVDALGFSQGGQFLRGLLERCDDLSIRSLITFGSQHNGIAEFQNCGTFDFLCKAATSLVKSNAWTHYVQGKVVPAQYYRTVNDTTGLPSDEYLEYSNFLADVNNERATKNETYKERIASLEKFVMFVFEEDVTVIPKQSGWFAEVNATSGEVTPLRERTLYKEDWLGLKKLDEKGGLVFKIAEGKHMQLKDKVLRKAFAEFFGPEKEKDDEDQDSLVPIGAPGEQIVMNEDPLSDSPL
jgi:palmitoyl-protein thioesterase